MSGRDVENDLRDFFERVATQQPSDHLLRAVSAARVAAPAQKPTAWGMPRLAFSLLGLAATVVLAAGLVLVVANRGAFVGPGGAGGSGGPGSVGAFTPTASMTTGRSGATATLLSDGRVLIAGGVGAGGVGVGGVVVPGLGTAGSAELYDPRTGKFQATGSMAVPRSGHTATLLSDGRVLIIGGFGTGSAEVYDPKAGTFSLTGSMTTARQWYTATLLANGKVLVTGGVGTTGSAQELDSAELWDPASGAFSPTGSMTTPRGWHTATRLPDGRVLIAGGDGPSGMGLATAELYDPASGTFSPAGSMSLPHSQHTATALADGRVLIAGGLPYKAGESMGGGGPSAEAEIYDPATGTFTPTGSMAIATEFYSTTLLADGRVLFAGGDFGTGSFSSAQTYNPASGKFSKTASMSIEREGHTATLLQDGRVLITGGQTTGSTGAGTPLSSAELFTP